MTIRSVAGLASAGLVGGDGVALEAVARRYAIAITPVLAGLIAADDPADPLAAQFVPHPDELVTEPSELDDPIGDAAHSPVSGIVHRYRDRVLLKLLHLCPVYCRFCFRRESVGPGQDAILPPAAVERALAYIADTPAVWEVILSGGDPLILSPRRLAEIMTRLGSFEHVGVIRLHSRVPVADPDRITDALTNALRSAGKAVFVVLHANHANEFGPDARAAVARLVDAGIPMLSQSVLLRGVNDAPDTLEALMRAFVANRIKPYYLHQADLAPGTLRFRTRIEEGQALVETLRGDVSGLCQPTYVLDIPGGHGKVPLARSAVLGTTAAGTVVRDRAGRSHVYPDPAETGCG